MTLLLADFIWIGLVLSHTAQSKYARTCRRHLSVSFATATIDKERLVASCDILSPASVLPCPKCTPQIAHTPLKVTTECFILNYTF
jgi:hypothetical protein